MDTFGLSDLYTILIGTVAAGVVFVGAPVLWRRLREIIDLNPRRPMYHIVKGSQAERPPAPAVVMSRSALEPAVDGPSSHRQTADQTRQTAQTPPAPTKEQKLTLYKTMREQGISREKARPILAAMGMPLDNNLWAEAAPAESTASSPPEPRILMVRDNGNEPRPVVFDPDFPYSAPPA
jgi:hypothetical protein